jgi:hypothetical protein
MTTVALLDQRSAPLVKKTDYRSGIFHAMRKSAFYLMVLTEEHFKAM